MKMMRPSGATGLAGSDNARRERDAAISDRDEAGRLAHRYLALRALRQLARGHYLVVAGRTSLSVRLEGIPEAVHIMDEFIAGGLVEPVRRSPGGATWYALSSFGRDTLRRGEQWWSVLGYMERLQIRLGG